MYIVADKTSTSQIPGGATQVEYLMIKFVNGLKKF